MVIVAQGELGEAYVLYLLEDQEEKPVAVVLPAEAAEQPIPSTQEVLRALMTKHRFCSTAQCLCLSELGYVEFALSRLVYTDSQSAISSACAGKSCLVARAPLHWSGTLWQGAYMCQCLWRNLS